MVKFYKIITSTLIFTFFITIINAEESFCIDKKGLILPLFDETVCEFATETKINEKEFLYLIEFKESERSIELSNFRKNKNEIEKKEKEKIANKSEDEIKKIQKSKNELDQKKISKLAKQEEDKRIARQKELEIKKQKRLAEIEKRKKDKEEKRIARQKELEIQKELEKEERIAKKKLEEKLKKEKLAKKDIADKSIIKPSDNVNDKLKIIYFDKKIVKAESLPTINPSSNFDFEILAELSLDQVENLFSNNSNIILIIPKDIDSFSTVTSEDSMTSQMVAGIRQVPNPEFNRLQMEIRRAEREQQNALRRAEDGFRRSQCISCGLLTQWGGLAIQSKWNDVAKDLQNRIVRLTNS